jgi:hypothetical protein
VKGLDRVSTSNILLRYSQLTPNSDDAYHESLEENHWRGHPTACDKGGWTEEMPSRACKLDIFLSKSLVRENNCDYCFG